METVVDLIREHFGDEPGPDLIAKLGGKLPPEFKKFREHYDVWRREGHHVPPRKPSELRPFITGDYFTNNALSLYKLMFIRSSSGEDMFYEAVDVIKHHLLYCHSVALENPLQHLFFEREFSKGVPTYASPYLTGRGGLFGFDVNGGILFRNYLTFLSHLMPFLNAGIVVLVEAHWGGIVVSPIKLPDHDLSIVIDGLEIETANYFSGRPDNKKARVEAKQHIVGCFLEYLHFVAGIRQRTGGAIDVHITHERDRAVLSHLHRRFAELVGILRNNAELERLSILLKLSVPGLQELSAGDISALREGAAFADWRHALAGALDMMHAPDGPVQMQAGEDFRSLVLANLEPQIEQLNKEISKSSFLSKISGNALDIGVGVLLDFFLGTLGAVTATSLTKQGLLAAYKAKKDSGVPSQAKARMTHYALFKSTG